MDKKEGLGFHSKKKKSRKLQKEDFVDQKDEGAVEKGEIK